MIFVAGVKGIPLSVKVTGGRPCVSLVLCLGVDLDMFLIDLLCGWSCVYLILRVVDLVAEEMLGKGSEKDWREEGKKEDIICSLKTLPLGREKKGFV